MSLITQANPWLAVKYCPTTAQALSREDRELGDKIYELSRQGYWAQFVPNPDGTVSIWSHSGRYEEESHGEAYPCEIARGFYERLVKAGFRATEKLRTQTPGEFEVMRIQ